MLTFKVVLTFFDRFRQARGLAALLAAIGLMTATAPAAEAKTITVKAGQKAIIYSLYTISDSCQGGVRPRVAIRTPPQNGTAEVALVPYTVPAGKQCAGQKFKVTVVTYTPKAGFKGRDVVAVDAVMDMYSNGLGERSIGETVEVTVQ
jgi:hypothetical protein